MVRCAEEVENTSPEGDPSSCNTLCVCVCVECV